MSHSPRLILALSAAFARVVAAQAPISTTSTVDGPAISDRTPIELRLNRPLSPDEGELTLVVGGMDVTSVAERTPSSITYRPSAVALPAGETELVLYQRHGSRWTEIRRWSIRVTQAAGASHATFGHSATLGNKGQVAEGRTGSVPVPDRRTFQDFVLNAGLNSQLQDGRWTLATQSNYIGVSRRQEALGFATHGNGAPLLDLADYSVGLRTPNATATFGNVTFGNSRHLLSNFAARGGTMGVSHAGTSLSVGAMSGSPQVGWTDLIGVDRPNDRVFGATLGQELDATHPGMLRFDVAFLDGSKQPRPSFTQSAVVDAERSAGGSMQVSAALPNQRARIVTGYTRSRFENPSRDPQLIGDTVLKRPRPTTRGAHFVEANVVALQNLATPLGGPANVALAFRDERIDPLFRSVAASTQADHQQDGADATISIGAISGQVSQNWSHDNLDRLKSVLTTRSSTTTASLALPLATVAAAHTGRGAVLLPMLTLTFNATRQAADGTPVNGAFRPTDLPDQFNTVGDATALWQAGATRFSLRLNTANQDNRQDTRQNADFDSGVFGVSLGRTLGTRGDVSVDVGDEHQTARERNETTRTRRMTMNGSFRPRATLNVIGAFSVIDLRAPTGTTTVNTEQHLELSQGFNLWPAPASEPQRGQLFVRFARTGSLLPNVAANGIVVPPSLSRAQWTVATGANVRLF